MRNLKKKFLSHVKTKNYKETVRYSGGLFTAKRRLLLHGGGSVCLANLGGSCLHNGGSWRQGVPSLDINIDSNVYVLKGFMKPV